MTRLGRIAKLLLLAAIVIPISLAGVVVVLDYLGTSAGVGGPLSPIPYVESFDYYEDFQGLNYVIVVEAIVTNESPVGGQVLVVAEAVGGGVVLGEGSRCIYLDGYATERVRLVVDVDFLDVVDYVRVDARPGC